MTTVKRISAANKALRKSTAMNIFYTIFMVISIFLLLTMFFFQMTASFTELHNADEWKIFFKFYIFFYALIISFYVVMLYMYSGYFPFKQKDSAKGYGYEFNSLIYFAPISRHDYIVSAIINWIKCYSLFLITCAIQTAGALLLNLPTDIKGTIGFVYFVSTCITLISGIIILLPSVTNITKKRSFIFNAMLSVLFAASLIIYFMTYNNIPYEKFTWFCSVWGILCAAAVIPIVSAVIYTISKHSKAKSWFG